VARQRLEQAVEALVTGESVYDLVVEKGWLSKDHLDEFLDPARMTSGLAASPSIALEPRIWTGLKAGRVAG
jgi:hypothetical protein